MWENDVDCVLLALGMAIFDDVLAPGTETCDDGRVRVTMMVISVGLQPVKGIFFYVSPRPVMEISLDGFAPVMVMTFVGECPFLGLGIFQLEMENVHGVLLPVLGTCVDVFLPEERAIDVGECPLPVMVTFELEMGTFVDV